ncbi:RraA family protein [Gelria sp. Kuro-4]|uniref:RraA family protein n=1 Tax=Gelria sp. Kuro-4 TaxID=2796927 RepID=UPI001BF16837|nr:RraA family protein [Gelria sp. Kuro-4]BCV24900.1 hypothetical protein kuro4_16730 [Gelria sp. Kuro-4]
MIGAAEWEKYEHRLAGVVPKERFARLSFPRPRPEVLSVLKGIEDPTPTVSDILDQLGIAGTVPATILHPICAGKVVVGPALTIRYVAEPLVPRQAMLNSAKAQLGDKDAYAIAEPGDVVVFDNSGREDISTMGGLSTHYALKAGVAGCIVDGGVRDVGLMRSVGFGVWSRGITPITGKLRVATLEINGPVQCADVSVKPGDLVVADDNGVCFIPAERLDEVVAMVLEAAKTEEMLMQAISGGGSMDNLRSILPPEKW